MDLFVLKIVTPDILADDGRLRVDFLTASSRESIWAKARVIGKIRNAAATSTIQAIIGILF